MSDNNIEIIFMSLRDDNDIFPFWHISPPFESPFQHLFKHHIDLINKTIVFIVAVPEMHWKQKH